MLLGLGVSTVDTSGILDPAQIAAGWVIAETPIDAANVNIQVHGPGNQLILDWAGPVAGFDASAITNSLPTPTPAVATPPPVTGRASVIPVRYPPTNILPVAIVSAPVDDSAPAASPAPVQDPTVPQVSVAPTAAPSVADVAATRPSYSWDSAGNAPTSSLRRTVTPVVAPVAPSATAVSSSAAAVVSSAVAYPFGLSGTECLMILGGGAAVMLFLLGGRK